jgi:hypothetical protein
MSERADRAREAAAQIVALIRKAGVIRGIRAAADRSELPRSSSTRRESIVSEEDG